MTISSGGYVQYTSSNNFLIKAANTGLNTIKPGSTSYQSNWPITLKNTLGLNTLRFQQGGEGDVWNINMVNNPIAWATNLESLLESVDNEGLKIYFYTLGDPWGGELGIIDQGETFMDINLAKSYIDKLAGDNSLNHNFVADQRIVFWSVANEVMLGTVTQSGNVVPSSYYSWVIQICDYIKSKGGKVVVPSPYVDSSAFDSNPVNMGTRFTEPLLRGHVDYLETHQYGLWQLVTYYSLGNKQYDWAAWHSWMKSTLQESLDYRGSFDIDHLILGEFGIWRGVGSDMGLTLHNFTDQNRLDYYSNYFNLINQLGIKNICFHYSIEENAYYGNPSFCRYGMITPTPDGINFNGPAGQPYPGCEVIKANLD